MKTTRISIVAVLLVLVPASSGIAASAGSGASRLAPLAGPLLAAAGPPASPAPSSVTSEPSTAASTRGTPVTSSGTVPGTVIFGQFEVRVQVAPPQGWTALPAVNGYHDPEDPGVEFRMVVMPMGLPDKTLGHLNNSVLDQQRDRIKSGELVSAEMKNVDGVDGVLTVDSARSPAVRRLRWQAHARGHLTELTFTAPAARFESRLADFRKILDTAKVLAPPAPETR